MGRSSVLSLLLLLSSFEAGSACTYGKEQCVVAVAAGVVVIVRGWLGVYV
jgi:hypothetical protein